MSNITHYDCASYGTYALWLERVEMTDYKKRIDQLIASCTVIERDDNENDEKVIDVVKLDLAIEALLHQVEAESRIDEKKL